VFLFDEPLSNLDAKLRVQMRTEIKELHQRLKTTTIYVTHDQIEAMTMADKIVVMRDGRIEQVGAPLELFDRPANLFVAGFIGSPSMNLLKGVMRKGAKPGVEIVGTLFPIASDNAAQDGQAVVYGVRPEHLEIHPDGVPAKISVVEPTGSETLVFLRFGDGEMVALFRERHDFKPGDTLTLKPRLDQIHLFDAETGKRL
jgi:multiple sugar transport system ATP-binding protein